MATKLPSTPKKLLCWMSFLYWMMLINAFFNLGNVSGGCTMEDIRITQNRVPTSGRTEYTVQINNTCPSQCAPSDIHLHCRQFDFEGVSPETIKRLSYDDCLINEGNPLKTDESVNFTYSNSFMYPLTVLTANFC